MVAEFYFLFNPPVSSYPYESRSRRKHDIQTRAGWSISSNFILKPLPYFGLFFNSVLQTWGAKSFSRQNFCGRIFAFSLDIQTRISWVSDIKIKRLENPNSSTHVGLQFSWRIQGEIKVFYRIESSRNLVGKKWSPDQIQKLTNVEHPDMTESIT
jgi:hypothetical protein